MEIKRTHDRLYLNERYKEEPKEYFKLIVEEAKKDKGLNIDSSDTWLDIGCETGSFLFYLREKYKKLELFGMDVIPELLDHVNDGIVGGVRVTTYLASILDKHQLPDRQVRYYIYDRCVTNI